MAFIVPTQGETVVEEEVLEYLERKVAKFKYPKHIKFMDDLPLTPTMKVRKSVLKERFAREGGGRGSRGARPIRLG